MGSEKQNEIRELRLRTSLAKKLAACFPKTLDSGPCSCMGIEACSQFSCQMFWEILLENNGLEKAIKLYAKAQSIFAYIP